ncbi:PD-(D/E)XK nuclease family protein [Pseudomonas sp. Irchel 3E13]|uniref:PD-(D/E)XK nuclease family protein n=1 Tax=Pseudomonas sp. Irchel 3E13 TaxID=2008975 RepID=UPI00117A8CC9|nr:PD-(D/E)XK nuclease family protein [Pseudomonas sp. Irchel 3E13]
MNRAIGAWSENLPDALRGGRVVLSERDLATEIPVPLHGRGDQVFLVNGWLVPVDTKRRRREMVYMKDVIQLSVYAFILARQSQALFGRNLPVSGTGYIRIAGPSRTIYKPVALLNSAQIISLWNRYWALRCEGLRAAPRHPNETVCAGCSKKAMCPVGRRVR